MHTYIYIYREREMDEGSTGALVPAVKGEVKPFSAVAPAESGGATATETAEVPADELDRDLLCPICMQIIKDAFLTACGHSFCYMCIITHLHNKKDCPCCGHYLTNNQLFPNFLLDKSIEEDLCSPNIKNCIPCRTISSGNATEWICLQGCEVSVKELDTLLTLLAEKKRKLEQEEAERNMQILFDFLYCLRKQKVDELNEIQNDLQFIKEDINAVERHRIELYRARDRYSVKLRMLSDDPTATKSWPSPFAKNNSGFMSSSRNAQGGLGMGNFLYKKADGKAQVNTLASQAKDTLSGMGSEHVSQSSLAVARKKRVHAQFNDLQECYLQKRRQLANHPLKQEERDTNIIHREGYTAGLTEFQSVLSTFTRYRQSTKGQSLNLGMGIFFIRPILYQGIEFDRDDELFATAGVSRRIKIFDFSSVVNEPADVHTPVVEMSTRSKLSCLSWNKFTKNHIASSDYDGIVTVWDVTTRQSVMEYEEHEKRAWSVDFSRTEPSMLVSGSDDCKVKLWCTKQEASVLNINMKANICCVKYNPGSSSHIAIPAGMSLFMIPTLVLVGPIFCSSVPWKLCHVGSADHHIHYYDLRNASQPLHVFSGHRKAVSYVKFLSNDELASASTDSTLRLWDVKENLPVRTFRGHTNEKNFVGLTAISRQVTRHKFGSQEMDDTDEDAGSYFISAVCWKSDSPTMLAANSQGTIKVLVLAT
ncbi:unnamed protein product [Camellia sinensis]